MTLVHDPSHIIAIHKLVNRMMISNWCFLRAIDESLDHDDADVLAGRSEYSPPLKL